MANDIEDIRREAEAEARKEVDDESIREYIDSLNMGLVVRLPNGQIIWG